MLKLLLGDPNARKLKKYQPDITEINLLEEDIKPLSDEQLKAKTVEFKQRLANGETLDDILPEAFAVVRNQVGVFWDCDTLMYNYRAV